MSKDDEMKKKLAAALARMIEMDEESNLPPVPQQMERLRELYALYGVSHKFEPGQMVNFKRGLGALKLSSRNKLAVMFWRYFDLTNPRDVACMTHGDGDFVRHAGFEADCVIVILQDNLDALHMIANSKHLEPWTPQTEK